MVNLEKYTNFPSSNAIKVWAKTNTIQKMKDDIFYVQRGENFYYFGFDGKKYSLLMTSSKDLGEAQA